MAHWRPKIGNDIFEDVKYSRLAKIVDAKRFIKKKTQAQPGLGVEVLPPVKKDRKVPDPFTIQEAEALRPQHYECRALTS